MSCKLKFLPTALKEWKKLDNSLKTQFKKKFAERLEEPHVVSTKLSGFENHYEIKLKGRGYRLVYEVVGEELILLVITVGKREKILSAKKPKRDDSVNKYFHTDAANYATPLNSTLTVSKNIYL